MKDTELRARLRTLGMPAEQADDVTRQIRDRLQVVASLAVVRANEHNTALGLYEQYGDDGLAGYEVDGVSGLLKSIKKVAKKAVKAVGKVASVVAPVLPGPLALAAVGVAAGGAAIAKKSAKKKAKKAAAAAAAIPVPAAAAEQANSIAVELVKKNATPALVKPRGTRSPYVKLPVGQTQEFAPVATGLPPLQDQTAGLLQTLLSQQGTNMVSPPAQQILADVAQEGVEKTAAGPSAMPPWLLPVGIGGALLFLAMRGRK